MTLSSIQGVDVPAKLQVLLATTILDRAGNALAVPADAWTWQLPAWLDLGGPTALDAGTGLVSASATVRVANDGDVFVISDETQPGMGQYRARVRRFLRATGAWSTVGNGQFPGTALSRSETPGLVFDATGAPIASYGTTVARWEGSQWSPLSGSTPTPYVQALAQTAAGELIAATPTGVLKWSGSDWVAFGASPSFSVDQIVTTPSGDVYAGGTGPIQGTNQYVAFNVAKWSGGSWTTLGSPFTIAYGAVWQHSFDVGANGALFAMFDYVDQSTIPGIPIFEVHQWAGSSWSGNLSMKGINCCAGMRVSSDGRVYVVGSTTAAVGTLAVSVFQNAAWSSLPSPAANGSTSYLAALDVTNAPIVVIEDPGMHVRQYNQ